MARSERQSSIPLQELTLIEKKKMDRERRETEGKIRTHEGSESYSERSVGVTLRQQTQNKQKSQINRVK